MAEDHCVLCISINEQYLKFGATLGVQVEVVGVHWKPGHWRLEQQLRNQNLAHY